ncbi:hypothetical protein HCN44_009632 [Aphidius gifuensis]|uniref:Uncharacterized protein n=1 Tax=Aphidius gifuensis TaxID=684658 RepID=A0A835CVM2_APHGI|nr:uncharacterized protein LOC122860405 [Aphidius gifuensis]XP_044020137.1 uncharacterized protein LOC122860405 [Aphidius gifuensis]KAF7998234.1 hypothetical protein HCN44_009632 [Aphidius gifuensis]
MNRKISPGDLIDNIKKKNSSEKFSSINKTMACSQIKTVNDTKKMLSKVKVVGPAASSLKNLSKIHNTTDKKSEELNKYCRTCAGLKLPLIDIFSEKGMQMRLDQQMKHLENINIDDSLTTKMCMDCICDLKMSYKFFLQIKKAEIKLISISNDLTDKIDDEKNRKNNLSTQKKVDNIIFTDSIDDEIDDIDDIDNINDVYDDKMSSTTKKYEKIDDKNKDTSNAMDIQEDDLPVFSHKNLVPRDDVESIEEFDPDDNTIDSKENNKQVTQKNAKIINEKMDLSSYKIADSSMPDIKLIQSKKTHDDNSYENIETIEDIEKFINENNDDVVSNKQKPTEINNKPLMKKSSKDNKDKTESTIKKFFTKPKSVEVVEEPTVTTVDSLKSLEYNKMQHLMKKTNKVDSTNEAGVMYVTVAGSKPDELLLVKVKKLDKTTSNNNASSSTNDTNTNKKEEPIKLPKEPAKPLTPIEIEIENYKKKREKLLGTDVISASCLFDDNPLRFVNDTINETLNIGPITFNGVKREPGEKIEVHRLSSINNTILDKEDLTIPFETIENDGLLKPVSFDKLSRIKQEWLDPKYINITKKKKETPESIEAMKVKRHNDRLLKILGDTNKNIASFYDHLKQHDKPIDNMNDSEIISLYETHIIKLSKKKFPDLIDENCKYDDFGKKNFYECDYCTELYMDIDDLREHLTEHDEIMYYHCEDCGDDFPTSKLKRAHNVVCLKRLVCKYCNYMLDSIGKKRQHEQRHCDRLWGQLCDVCGEKFKHHGTLDQHYKTQHMFWEKKHQCPKCPKKFTFKAKLSFHLKSVHTTVRAYLCEDCGADFKNPASLRHHRIRKHNPTTNKKECPVCHKVVPYYSLSKHMYTHKEYTIKCPRCDKMFKNSSTLRQHLRIHEDQRQYRCDTCDVGFNRRDGLRLHMKVHEKGDSRSFKECSCQICLKTFKNHSLLVLHRNRVHKDAKQYTCKICNRSMQAQRSLNWHMSHIHNQLILNVDQNGENNTDSLNDERVVCQHCNKTFKTEMILRTHIKNTHVEKSPVKCRDCDETFTSEVRLRHHAMNVHERLDGTLKCPSCDKRFVNQLRLKTHMISHSEDRPFKCDICGFDLKTKIQLLKHHQNKHSDARPLKCSYCDWRCKQVSALVCHERTHTDERPYACGVCKQRFKYLGDRNKHEKRHEIRGGSGFKRLVAARNSEKSSSSTLSKVEIVNGTSNSDDQPMEFEIVQADDEHSEQQFIEGELIEQSYDEQMLYDENGCIIKSENFEYYEPVYEENDDALIAESGNVNYIVADTSGIYTEEVANEDIANVQITNERLIELDNGSYLQDGTPVHYLQQQDEHGQVELIPVIFAVGKEGAEPVAIPINQSQIIQ